MRSLTEIRADGEVLGFEGQELQRWVLAERDREKEEERERMRREEELERIRRDEEREERRLRREHELQMAQINAAALENRNNNQQGAREGEFKLPLFDARVDEIDSFLRRFEIHCKLYDWPKETWGRRLNTKLTGKATTVLATIPLEEVNDYDVIKRALLLAFQCNSHTFLEKFRKELSLDSNVIQF